MNRLVIPKKAAKSKLIEVLDDIEASVISTLGPKGRTVVLVDEQGTPQLTKDGVTVAKYLHYEDTLKQAMLEIIRESSIKLASKVGDGTTTAIMLAVGLIRETIEKDSINRQFIYELESGIDFITEYIKASSKQIDAGSSILQRIVYTATNSDKMLTSLIMEASKNVGKYGLIKASKGTAEDEISNVRVVSGIKFDSRILVTPYDLTTSQVIKNKTKLLLVEGPVSNVSDIKKILIDQELNSSDLIIVASEFSDKVKNVCIINNSNRTRRVTLVSAESFVPNRLTILEDAAEILDTVVYSTNGSTAHKLKNADISKLGDILEYVLSKYELVLTIYKKSSKDFSDKIKFLHYELKKLERSTVDDYISKQHILRFRLNKFVKVANIKIVGKTDLDMNEILDRVDDALSAYKAALINGVVPGGGIMLLMAVFFVMDNLPESVKGILTQTAKYPIMHIVDDRETFNKIITDLYNKKFVQYDVLSEAFVTDESKISVFDPTDVLISALDTAVTITKTILNTSAFVIQDN